MDLKLEAYNKHDAAAIAALYTQDAVRVAALTFFGRKAIKKGFAADFPSVVRKLV